MRTYKGRFEPQNTSKYLGDSKNIIYRSSWELKVMRYFDVHPSVLKWSSEEIVIPYFDPTRRKQRRYFPDFYVEFIDVDKKLQKWLIEVKPSAQTKRPVKSEKKSKKVRKKFLYESFVYAVNNAKWQAAEAYCTKHGMKFMIWTEANLFNGKV